MQHMRAASLFVLASLWLLLHHSAEAVCTGASCPTLRLLWDESPTCVRIQQSIAPLYEEANIVVDCIPVAVW